MTQPSRFGASAPGRRTPARNAEAPAAGTARGFEGGQENGHRDFAADSGYRKAVAGLRAEAALAGRELTHLDDGRLLLCRWGWCKVMRTVAEVEREIGRMRRAAR